MIRPIRIRRKRVLIDIDTQKDLFLADGAACIRNHRRILMNLRRVTAWARAKGVRIVSTQLSRPGKGEDFFCISGTDGQQKINYTNRNRRICFEADGRTDLSRDMFLQNDQVILKKTTENPFDQPRAERLLSELKADEFIVIGAVTEGAVIKTVLGLLQRGKRVSVVVDCLGTHDRQKADMALRKMKAKGANLTDTKSVAGASHLKGVGLCHCKLCQTSSSLEKQQRKTSLIA